LRTKLKSNTSVWSLERKLCQPLLITEKMFAYRETVLEEAHRGMELREHCRHIVDNDDRHYRFHSLCVHQGIGVSSRTTPFPFPSFSAHAEPADSLSFAFLLSAYVDLAMRFS
ncbi:hypothetical protein ACJX0J_019341, partial [Zea mays]